ncbi:hypothetical protein D9M69_478360 [compost metagenome]
MPTGSWSTFSGVPAFSIAMAYSFDWMPAYCIARLARNGASAWLSVIFTVWSSMRSTDFSSLGMPMSLK